jgi:hypothetical protein
MDDSNQAKDNANERKSEINAVISSIPKHSYLFLGGFSSAQFFLSSAATAQFSTPAAINNSQLMCNPSNAILYQISQLPPPKSLLSAVQQQAESSQLLQRIARRGISYLSYPGHILNMAYSAEEPSRTWSNCTSSGPFEHLWLQFSSTYSPSPMTINFAAHHDFITATERKSERSSRNLDEIALLLAAVAYFYVDPLNSALQRWDVGEIVAYHSLSQYFLVSMKGKESKAQQWVHRDSDRFIPMESLRGKLQEHISPPCHFNLAWNFSKLQSLHNNNNFLSSATNQEICFIVEKVEPVCVVVGHETNPLLLTELQQFALSPALYRSSLTVFPVDNFYAQLPTKGIQLHAASAEFRSFYDQFTVHQLHVNSPQETKLNEQEVANFVAKLSPEQINYLTGPRLLWFDSIYNLSGLEDSEISAILAQKGFTHQPPGRGRGRGGAVLARSYGRGSNKAVLAILQHLSAIFCVISTSSRPEISEIYVKSKKNCEKWLKIARIHRLAPYKVIFSAEYWVNLEDIHGALYWEEKLRFRRELAEISGLGVVDLVDLVFDYWLDGSTLNFAYLDCCEQITTSCWENHFDSSSAPSAGIDSINHCAEGNNDSNYENDSVRCISEFSPGELIIKSPLVRIRQFLDSISPLTGDLAEEWQRRAQTNCRSLNTYWQCQCQAGNQQFLWVHQCKKCKSFKPAELWLQFRPETNELHCPQQRWTNK